MLCCTIHEPVRYSPPSTSIFCFLCVIYCQRLLDINFFWFSRRPRHQLFSFFNVSALTPIFVFALVALKPASVKKKKNGLFPGKSIQLTLRVSLPCTEPSNCVWCKHDTRNLEAHSRVHGYLDDPWSARESRRDCDTGQRGAIQTAKSFWRDFSQSGRCTIYLVISTKATVSQRSSEMEEGVILPCASTHSLVQ